MESEGQYQAEEHEWITLFDKSTGLKNFDFPRDLMRQHYVIGDRVQGGYDHRFENGLLYLGTHTLTLKKAAENGEIELTFNANVTPVRLLCWYSRRNDLAWHMYCSGIIVRISRNGFSAEQISPQKLKNGNDFPETVEIPLDNIPKIDLNHVKISLCRFTKQGEIGGSEIYYDILCNDHLIGQTPLLAHKSPFSPLTSDGAFILKGGIYEKIRFRGRYLAGRNSAGEAKYESTGQTEIGKIREQERREQRIKEMRKAEEEKNRRIKEAEEARKAAEEKVANSISDF